MQSKTNTAVQCETFAWLNQLNLKQLEISQHQGLSGSYSNIHSYYFLLWWGDLWINAYSFYCQLWCDHSSSGTIITCVNGNDIKRIDGDYGIIISKLQFTEKERYENIKENGQLAGFIDEAIAAGDGQWIVDYIRSKGKVAAWEFQSMKISSPFQTASI